MSSFYFLFAILLSAIHLSYARFPHFGYYSEYPALGYYGLADPYSYTSPAYSAYPYGYPYALRTVTSLRPA